MAIGATGTPTSLGIPTINGDVDDPNEDGINSIVAQINALLSAIPEGQLALTDITTNDVTNTRHGFVPKAPNTGSKFLRDDGTWATLPTGNPTMGGDLSGPSSNAQIVAGAVGAAEIADGTVTDTEIATANKDGSAGTPSMRTLGSGAAQAAAGNDSRLSDTRTPTDNTVSTTKLQDGAVTDVKMAVKMRGGTSSGVNTGGADITVTFATAFPTACDGVSVTAKSAAAQNWNPRITSISASGFTFTAVGSNNDQTINYSYVAVGH